MTLDILDAHFDLQKTCNYLHFALQSWNNAMLQKMNRRHNYEDFKNMVHYLRKKDPLFSISTDIIVGFSWETEEMFQDTIKAFIECEFDFAYIARYSVRPNTIAAKVMPDDIPDHIKSERWHILNTILLKNVQKRNNLMIWRTEEILISGEKDGHFFGRTRNFKEVFFPHDIKYAVGDIVDIKITELDRYVLKWIYS
jgi:tRNA-2-methylthio-N6-dimethylallyladenosine synthase